MESKYKSCRYNGKRMREHRVYLISILPTCARPSEFVVHHIDGNGRNNHPDNLRIMTAREHNRLHSRMRRRDRFGRFA